MTKNLMLASALKEQIDSPLSKISCETPPASQAANSNTEGIPWSPHVMRVEVSCRTWRGLSGVQYAGLLARMQGMREMWTIVRARGEMVTQLSRAV